jgi:hypothetical protein
MFGRLIVFAPFLIIIIIIIIIYVEVININVRNFNFPIGFYSNPHPFEPLQIWLTPFTTKL